MICGKDCPEYWATATDGHGICHCNFLIAPTGEECTILMHCPKVCCDCDRFGFDYACLTAKADDTFAAECPGFIYKQEKVFRNWIYEMLKDGRNPREIIEDELEECENSVEYKFIKEYINEQGL